MRKVCVCFAQGCEECEGLIVVDLLRRAGIDTAVFAVGPEAVITGAHNIQIVAEGSEPDWQSLDMLVLPGGMPGTKHLAASPLVRHQIHEFIKSDRWVAAICAAPSILGELGLLRGHKATCFPGFEDSLTGAELVNAGVVVSGRIITGRALGSAIPFALALIEALKGKPAADAIAEQIVYTT